MTNVEGDNADFIDQSGQVYPGIACRQVIEDTSTLLAEYPTWKDAVNSTEFKTGEPKHNVMYVVYKNAFNGSAIPQCVFKTFEMADKFCKDNDCDFVDELAYFDEYNATVK